jgi:hypothetical protein
LEGASVPSSGNSLPKFVHCRNRIATPELSDMSKDIWGAEMRGAAFVERYRSYAAECIRISRNVSDPVGKLVLLEMAQSWLKLAEQAAEGAEIPVGHETAVPATPQSD